LTTTRLFSFPAQTAARHGKWNDVAAVLDWFGIADLSCHQINPYFAGRRVDPPEQLMTAAAIKRAAK
jgi:hypothetical protein